MSSYFSFVKSLNKGVSLKHFMFPFLIFLSFSCDAFSSTLIVTHPELEWDPNATAALGTRELFLREDFEHKILLSSGAALTFVDRDLKIKKVFSGQGELILPNLKESNFTMAGGLFTACAMVSVVNVIQLVRGDLSIEFPLNAIFENPLGHPSPITLDEYRRKFGTEKFEALLVSHAKVVFRNLNSKFFTINHETGRQLHLPRQDQNLTISIYHRKKLIGRVGKGKQRVSFQFD